MSHEHTDRRETSILSFYFDSRRDVEMQACRKWTRLWWSLPKPDTDLVTGFPLLAELNQAPSPKREQALDLIRDLAQITPKYVCQYYHGQRLPRRNRYGVFVIGA